MSEERVVTEDDADRADGGAPKDPMAPPTLLGRIAIVLGLLALAVVQPIFDLLGNNPAFFVAGNYTSRQIITFAIVVVVVPALVLALVTAVIQVTGRFREPLFAVLLALLGGLFGNVVARGMGFDGGRAGLVAGLLGAGLAYGAYRLRAGRLLLQYLAAANLLFLFGFLVLSPTAKLIGGDGGDADLGSVDLPTLPGPVVVVVYDEFVLDVIMNPDGTINAERYPAFAELASQATWFRNASSDHNRTERAVPELLTGTQPPIDALPSYVDLPRNLLTLFASEVPVERYEAITDMCPPSLCAAKSPGSMEQLFEDVAIVYGHRVLPSRLRSDLPVIDQAWGGFGDTVTGTTDGDDDIEDAEGEEEGSDPCAPRKGGRLQKLQCMGDGERSPFGQALQLQAIGEGIEADVPALHFAHVVLPHRPYTSAAAIGPIQDDDPYAITQVLGAPPELVTDPADPAFDRSRAVLYQRAALQHATADVALGSVIADLKDQGAWEDATVVAVADHGVSLLPTYGREVDGTNAEEVYRVPMLIKAPGQRDAEVVDDPASTLDLLPTLIDLLDIETDWEFAGHSLLDGSEATVESRVSTSVDALLDLVARHAEDVPPGDWVDLASIGEHAALVGRPLDELEVGAASDLRLSASGQEDFADLPTRDAGAPQTLTGLVQTPDGSRPPELVVSVNGTIGGTIDGYVRADDGRWRFGTILGPYLVDGPNEIVAYEVDADGTLHPLTG